MTDTLRIVEGDWIEFRGVRVVRLLPVGLSLRDQLSEIFSAVDEDAETIEQLEERMANLEEAAAATRDVEPQHG